MFVEGFYSARVFTQADGCISFQYLYSTRVSLGFSRKRMLKSVRGLLRENDSQVEMGRKQDWAERTSDYSPDLTEFQPSQYGTPSDDDSERSPVLVRSPRVLAVIVMAGAAWEGPVLGQGLKAMAAGSAQGLVFEWQVLSLERSEWCLSPGSFEIYLIISEKNVSFKKSWTEH